MSPQELYPESAMPDQTSQAQDLGDLAAQVKNMAAEKKLAVVPAMPMANNGGFVVVLDQDDMTASEFCDLAVTAGAAIIYIQASGFDADRDLTMERNRYLDWENSEENTGLASLRQEASAHNGSIGEIALGFAADGILHSWVTTARWFDGFLERLQELEPDSDPRFARIPESEERELVERLASELAQMPEFKAAPTAAQRRRIAHAQPEIATLEADNRPGYRNAAFRAIHEAAETVAAEADSLYREVEGNLAQLAAECEATPSFRNAGSARARRERARDFLAEKAGGYPPPTRLLELFLDTPPLQNVRTGRH